MTVSHQTQHLPLPLAVLLAPAGISLPLLPAGASLSTGDA